jgi:superoxide dismutase, Cu-Zn family
MRSMIIAALGAALLLGCDDDDDGSDDDTRNDASLDASRVDASLDASPGLDATTDSGGSDGGIVTRASATLQSKSNSMVTGTADFALRDGVVTLEVAVSGASPGEHGIHIHVTGNCDSADGSSAGGHWNPDNHMHGSGAADASASSHLGDLGNITVAGDGKGVLSISKPEWTLGGGAATDVVGHAIVFHANEDDLVTNNGDAGPGNSGSRLACGVINPLP